MPLFLKHACCMIALWAVASSSSADAIDLYIISGQSNCFETLIEPDDGVPAELTQEYADIRYAYYDIYYGASSGWTPLRPRELYTPIPGLGPGIGVEMSFGIKIDAARDNPIAVIKAWRGGADLDEDFAPAVTDGLMAYAAMMSYIDIRIGELEAQGHTVNPAGFAWIQGESDAAKGPEQASRYGDNLAEFIAAIRGDLDAQDLPFVYNRLNIGVDYLDKAGVRAGQEWVAAHVPNVTMIDVDDVLLGPDTHHYGIGSQIEIGDRLATALIPEPTALPLLGVGLLFFKRRSQCRGFSHVGWRSNPEGAVLASSWREPAPYFSPLSTDHDGSKLTRLK